VVAVSALRLDRATEAGLALMVEREPRLQIVADTLRDVALDATVSPRVFDQVCAAIFAALDLWLEAL